MQMLDGFLCLVLLNGKIFGLERFGSAWFGIFNLANGGDP